MSDLIDREALPRDLLAMFGKGVLEVIDAAPAVCCGRCEHYGKCQTWRKHPVEWDGAAGMHSVSGPWANDCCMDFKEAQP